jgi:hypothetical protein
MRIHKSVGPEASGFSSLRAVVKAGKAAMGAALELISLLGLSVGVLLA